MLNEAIVIKNRFIIYTRSLDISCNLTKHRQVLQSKIIIIGINNKYQKLAKWLQTKNVAKAGLIKIN